MLKTLARRAAATFVAAALVFDMLAPPSATADEVVAPSLEVSPAPRDGGEVTLEGKGFATTGPGIYVAIAPAQVQEFYGNSTRFYGGEDATRWIYTPAMASTAQGIPLTHPLGTDGSFSITLPAPKFDASQEYVVLSTKAHGVGRSDTSNNLRIPLRYAGQDAAEPAHKCAPKTHLKLADNSLLADPSIVWGVNSLFLNYAQGQGYTMSTVDAWPQGGERIVFDKKGKTTLEGTTLNSEWGGMVNFLKDGVTHFAIGKPRVSINDPNTAEVYLSYIDYSANAEAVEREVHIGQAHSPIYLAQDPRTGYEIIHMLNAPITLNPAAAGVFPGLSVNSEIPPISVRIDTLDRSQANPAAFYTSLIDPSEECGLLPWMTQWMHVDQPDVIPVDPTPIPPPTLISIEEENSRWNESGIAAAAEGELHWGIKESWRNYIGGAELSEGARFANNSYVFSGGTLTRHEDGSSTIDYQGKIHFEAYGGALYLTFSDPQVRIGADGTSMLWMKQWLRADPTKPEVDAGYFPAAVIAQPGVEESGSFGVSNSPTYLTKVLAETFIFAYREGLRMSNLSYSVKLPEQPGQPGEPVETPQPGEPGQPGQPGVPSVPSETPTPSETEGSQSSTGLGSVGPILLGVGVLSAVVAALSPLLKTLLAPYLQMIPAFRNLVR